MFNYDKKDVVSIAKANDFLVNNTEKVLRLSKILNYICNIEYGKYLCLKGGTAINLFILDLPRLSVDIDFDFSFDCSKDEMIKIREKIKEDIINYMLMEEYVLANNTKYTHSLDSFVFSYNTTSGSKDNLKIEINYSNRVHALPTVLQKIKISMCGDVLTHCLSFEELIGSKVNALIARTTPRDVYDTYNLLKLKELDLNFIKKIAILYVTLSSDIPIDFVEKLNVCIKRIEDINYNKLRDNLIPLLHRSEKIEIDILKKSIIGFLKNIFILNDNEKKFIDNFNEGIFDQKLLFEDYIVNDLSKHPMVIWKINNLK